VPFGTGTVFSGDLSYSSTGSADRRRLHDDPLRIVCSPPGTLSSQFRKIRLGGLTGLREQALPTVLDCLAFNVVFEEPPPVPVWKTVPVPILPFCLLPPNALPPAEMKATGTDGAAGIEAQQQATSACCPACCPGGDSLGRHWDGLGQEAGVAAENRQLPGPPGPWAGTECRLWRGLQPAIGASPGADRGLKVINYLFLQQHGTLRRLGQTFARFHGRATRAYVQLFC